MIIPFYKGKSEADGGSYSREISIVAPLDVKTECDHAEQHVGYMVGMLHAACSTDRQAMSQAGFTENRRMVDHAFTQRMCIISNNARR